MRSQQHSIDPTRDSLVRERISDLYTTARETRSVRADMSEQTGPVTRTGWTIARRLVSIGHSVTGQHA